MANKNEEVNKYYDLNVILKLDIPFKVSSEIKDKFGKMIFYDKDGICKIGKLCGLEKKDELSPIYYIVEDLDGNKLSVPVWKSITKV